METDSISEQGGVTSVVGATCTHWQHPSTLLCLIRTASVKFTITHHGQFITKEGKQQGPSPMFSALVLQSVLFLGYVRSQSGISFETLQNAAGYCLGARSGGQSWRQCGHLLPRLKTSTGNRPRSGKTNFTLVYILVHIFYSPANIKFYCEYLYTISVEMSNVIN